MIRLEYLFKKAGYDARSWSYPSHRKSIEANGAALKETLLSLSKNPEIQQIHLVGHSLGSILARYAMGSSPPEKIGRIVMLAPPNQGSPGAKKLLPILGPWVKPLADLCGEQGSILKQLPPPSGVEIGVIAARSDFQVPVPYTHLDGESAHVVVPGSHSFITYRTDVFNLAKHFLETGTFPQTA